MSFTPARGGWDRSYDLVRQSLLQSDNLPFSDALTAEQDGKGEDGKGVRTEWHCRLGRKDLRRWEHGKRVRILFSVSETDSGQVVLGGSVGVSIDRGP
jgi:hypothetical protein